MWGYFRVTSVFFCSEMRVTRWLFCHSDITKFNYRWESLRHPSTFSVSQQWALLVFIVEQNSVGIFAVVFCRCLGIHTMRHRTVIWNMTEIHNMSQRLQNLHHARKIRQSSLCGFRVMQADRQTDGQINRHTHHNTSRTCGSTAHHVYHALARWCESVVRATMKVYEKGGNLNLIKTQVIAPFWYMLF